MRVANLGLWMPCAEKRDYPRPSSRTRSGIWPTLVSWNFRGSDSRRMRRTKSGDTRFSRLARHSSCQTERIDRIGALCGRFTQSYTWSEIRELYGLTDPARNLQVHYNRSMRVRHY